MREAVYRPPPGRCGLRLQSFATDVDNIKYTTHIYTIHATPKGSWKFEAGAARQPPPRSTLAYPGGIGVAASRVSVHAP